MNVSFTDKQEHYIASQVAEGDYQNASEVVRDALRVHELYRHHILNELKAAIDKGWQAPTKPTTVDDIISRKQQRLRKK